MTVAALFIVATLFAARSPEECIVVSGRSAASVTHAGKIYEFRHRECRDEFLTDPERYSQLYDALLELAAQGVALEPPVTDDSLVPS